MKTILLQVLLPLIRSFTVLISLMSVSCNREEVNVPDFLRGSYIIEVTKTSAVIWTGASFEGSFPVTESGVCWSTTENPTINDQHTSDGTGTGTFTSTITGLAPNTLYFLRPYATNKAGTGYGNQTYIKTKAGEVTDIDGNRYSTIVAGNKEWISENLKTTKLNDGTEIPLVTDKTDWSNQSSPACCWYNNTEFNPEDTYGLLYNWHAVSTGKLCPTGWHVSNLNEWYTLVYPFDNNLQGKMESKIAGCALVKPDSAQFTMCPVIATNESGFSAIAGGWRYEDGTFNNDKISSWFWLPEDPYATSDFTFIMYVSCGCGSKQVDSPTGKRRSGYSVRCVKD